MKTNISTRIVSVTCPGCHLKTWHNNNTNNYACLSDQLIQLESQNLHLSCHNVCQIPNSKANSDFRCLISNSMNPKKLVEGRWTCCIVTFHGNNLEAILSTYVYMHIYVNFYEILKRSKYFPFYKYCSCRYILLGFLL